MLDNYEGNYDRLTVGVLAPAVDRYAYGMEGPSEAEHGFLWSTSAYGVDGDGEIISDITIPDSAAYCLLSWLPPADYRGSLAFVHHDTGARHAIEIKSEDIVRTNPDDYRMPELEI